MDYLTRNRAINIFSGFLKREGVLTGYEAFAEINRVLSVKTMKEYFRVSRKGSTVPLTRRQRMSIWMLWENAQNHADYEDWLDEQERKLDVLKADYLGV